MSAPAPCRDDGRIRHRHARYARPSSSATARARRCSPDRQTAEGRLAQQMIVDGYDAPVTLAATLTISDTGIHVDYTGTSPHRVMASTCRSPTPPPTRCSGSAAWWRVADPEQCGLARAADRVGAVGLDPQCAEARAGGIAPRHRADAARRGVRLPASDHSRARAGRGHVVPVESQRARRDAAAAPAAITGSHGGHQQRRHRRAVRQGRTVGHRLSQRRARHAGRDRRDARRR